MLKKAFCIFTVTISFPFKLFWVFCKQLRCFLEVCFFFYTTINLGQTKTLFLFLKKTLLLTFVFCTYYVRFFWDNGLHGYTKGFCSSNSGKDVIIKKKHPSRHKTTKCYTMLFSVPKNKPVACKPEKQVKSLIGLPQGTLSVVRLSRFTNKSKFPRVRQICIPITILGLYINIVLINELYRTFCNISINWVFVFYAITPLLFIYLFTLGLFKTLLN